MHLQHYIAFHHLKVMSVACVKGYFYATIVILPVLKVQYKVTQTICGAYVASSLHNH
jgi:hypothetical protein